MFCFHNLLMLQEDPLPELETAESFAPLLSLGSAPLFLFVWIASLILLDLAYLAATSSESLPPSVMGSDDLASSSDIYFAAIFTT